MCRLFYNFITIPDGILALNAEGHHNQEPKQQPSEIGGRSLIVQTNLKWICQDFCLPFLRWGVSCQFGISGVGTFFFILRASVDQTCHSPHIFVNETDD
jgi:hypothetical protein